MSERSSTMTMSLDSRRLADVNSRPTAIFEGDLDVITTPLEARRLHHGIAHSIIHMVLDIFHGFNSGKIL